VALVGRPRYRIANRPASRHLSSATVDICLGTYNGEKYLPSFYASIAAQSHADWRLLVRDDGSGDSTWDIIGKLAKDDSRVVPIVDRSGNLGVVGNFAALLSRSAADYVMLADQDDIWYPNKIRDSLHENQALQAQNCNGDRPVLVFTDLHVVGEELNVLNESFIRMQGLESLRGPSFVQLLTQNVAPGCTMMMNRSLIDAALPIPSEAAMHDWWLILVAAALGNIGFIAKPTMAYRQHGSNLIGAKSLSLRDAPMRIAKYRSRLRQAQRQAGQMVYRYSERMRNEDVAAASMFETLSRFPVGVRQMQACRHGLRKAGFIRNIAFFLFM
jgi:glycosyltransferase involved in cell wall biosynthesis